MNQPVPGMTQFGGEGAKALSAVDSFTRRVATESLQRGGFTTVRILDEALFRSAIEQVIEERVKALISSQPPAPAPAPAADALAFAEAEVARLREEYRKRWDEFRRRFEDKLRRLESAAGGCAA